MTSPMRMLAFIGFFCLTPSMLFAQHHPLLVEGSKHMQAENWQAAIQAFTKLTEAEPKHQVAWFQLGDAHFQAGAFEKAIAAYAQSEALGFFPYIIRVPIAKAHIQLGQKDEAIAWLHKAIEAGFGDVTALKTDDAFDALRKHPGFSEVMLAADKVAHPCKYDVAYDALDFWVGDWVVQNKQGYRVGESQVFTELSDCSIIENWHSIWANSNARNYTSFDPSTGVWHQIFVSERATAMNLSGKAQDGKVIFEGPGRNTAGEAVLVRLTFEPIPEKSGARQTIDHSKDDGVTWTNIGILSYYPKVPVAQKTANVQKP